MTKEEGINGVSPTPQGDSTELAECSASRPTFGGARLPNGLQTFAEQFSIPHLNMFDATKLPSRKTRHPPARRGLQPNRALGWEGTGFFAKAITWFGSLAPPRPGRDAGHSASSVESVCVVRVPSAVPPGHQSPLIFHASLASQFG
jgi:hypothetical protein